MDRKVINKVFKFEIMLFVVLLVWYYSTLSPLWSYSGYIIDYFSIGKLVISFILFTIISYMGILLKSQVYYFIYQIFLIKQIMPGFIMWIFTNISIVPTILLIVPILLLLLVDKLGNTGKWKIRKLKLDTPMIVFLMLITLVSIAPFIRNISQINIKNLLFQDVYETRYLARESRNFLTAYLSSPLSRYVLPFLSIYFFVKKKKSLFVLTFFMVIFIFLTSGAHKSFLITYFITMFFINQSYEWKIHKFLKYLNMALIIDIITFTFFKISIISTYLRRAFFVPVDLFNRYYSYFTGNSLYYSHTRIAELLGIKSNYRGLTGWFGTNVINKPGLNANVGAFAEGYVSIGIIGVILVSLVFVTICLIYEKLDISLNYAGLLFIVVDLFNSVLIEQFFITHGTLLYILMLIFLIPRTNLTNRIET